jgi:soluble lytic murein transglycosylase-like protein
MKKLILALAMSAAILLAPRTLSATGSQDLPFFMYNASNNFKIDIALLYAICKVESNCRSGAINNSDSNAAQRSAGIIDKSYGLFQIKLSTAKSLGFKTVETVKVSIKKKHKTLTVYAKVSKAKDLLRPDINAWYAAKLLRHLFNKYHDTSKVISAYNAGRPISTNTAYVNKVLNNYANYKLNKRF